MTCAPRKRDSRFIKIEKLETEIVELKKENASFRTKKADVIVEFRSKVIDVKHKEENIRLKRALAVSLIITYNHYYSGLHKFEGRESLRLRKN